MTESAHRSIPVVHHRTTQIGQLEIFYREAGEENRHTIVLLHGFPSSSHMFRNLIPAIADKYHVIAPDLPGFGLSTSPDRSGFAYTFEMFADTVAALLDRLGISRYAAYVMDYGAPVGFRLALNHQTQVSALIIQNGNAYEEGLQEFWDPIRALWSDNSEEHRDALRPFLRPDMTRMQYVDGVKDLSRLDPAAWLHDQIFLDRPGNADIQLDLLYDYRRNVELYPSIQGCLRFHQPPTLILWGANDRIFPAEGARAYLKDLPDAELHLLDTGHFALEDKLDEMAPLIRDFLARTFGN
jgi:pimeloyl-ACP methyl ester carboxylesterase